MSHADSARLSTGDIAGIDRVRQAFLRPLDYPDVDSWRYAIGDALKTLLGADMATSYLPISGIQHFYSADVPISVANAYPARVRPLDRRWSIWDRQAALGVSDRQILWRPSGKELLRSAYYNDWVVPNRLYSALTISARLSQAPAGVPPVPTLWLHHDRPRSGGFGKRGRAIMHRVLPAFAASAEIIRLANAHRDAFTRILDDLGFALLIVDALGKQHRTPALEQLLMSDPEAPEILDVMVAAAKKVALDVFARLRVAQPAYHGRDVASKVSTVGGTYRVRAALAPAEFCGSRACAIVSCEPATAPLPDIVSLADRYHLTPAQGRVALLIAQGRSSEEIASALGITVHTVRRHSERVRAQLGVHRAVEVAALLRRSE